MQQSAVIRQQRKVNHKNDKRLKSVARENAALRAEVASLKRGRSGEVEVVDNGPAPKRHDSGHGDKGGRGKGKGGGKGKSGGKGKGGGKGKCGGKGRGGRW